MKPIPDREQKFNDIEHLIAAGIHNRNACTMMGVKLRTYLFWKNTYKMKAKYSHIKSIGGKR